MLTPGTLAPNTWRIEMSKYVRAEPHKFAPNDIGAEQMEH